MCVSFTLNFNEERESLLEACRLAGPRAPDAAGCVRLKKGRLQQSADLLKVTHRERI